MVVDAIIWGIKHPLRNVADTGTIFIQGVSTC